MCGLVVTTLSLDEADAAWKNAVTRLECRGPDDSGELVIGGVRFGHRRLEIIGLGAVGHQPYSSEDRSDALAFNGEIYNYRELGREIGLVPESDTQVLHELLRRRDYERLDRMRGMYACVYWDSLRQELITLRDPFGIKPLYLRRHVGGEVSFASVPASLAHLGSRAEPAVDGIAGFLASGYFRVGETAFAGIEKVPPGHITTWRRVGSTWQHSQRPIDWSAIASVSVFDALSDSVRLHLTSDVPVGVLLSGGVDSTLIAALAARDIPTLQSFSLVNPENPDIDEAVYAEHNARLIGLAHSEVPVTAARLADEVPEIIQSTGEPFGDASFLPLAVLSSEVAKHVKVALAGEGADELFGGYRRYDVERHLYRRKTARALRTLGRSSRFIPRRFSLSSQAERTLATWASGPGYYGHSQLFSPEWDAMGHAFPLPTERSLKSRNQSWERLATDPFAYGLPVFQAFDLREWLPNSYLEKSDRASMLSGLEVRVPFLDSWVAASIRDLRVADSKKRPLRDLLVNLVPGVRLPRRKMGLTVATGEVMSSASLTEPLIRILSDKGGLLADLGGQDLELLRKRAADNEGFRFRLTTLAIWAEQWL